jgi:nitrate reductase delta subunit
MAMLGAAKKSAAQLAALDRVKEWTRTRFSLAPDAVIMVGEVACSLPGCPPLETVVVFWGADGTRHQFKLFKTPGQVLEEDLPYAWLRKSLEALDDAGFDCC